MEGRKRTQVAEVQRARLIAAATEVAWQRRGRPLTVAAIVSRARVSRRSFYDLFANGEECLAEALADVLAQARQRVLAAQQHARGGWQARTRAGLHALLAFFDESPGSAHLLVVESLLAGTPTQDLREQALQELISAVDKGREAGGRRDGPSAITAEAIVGGALAIVYRRLLHDAQRRLDRKAVKHARRRNPAGAASVSIGHLVDLTGPLMSTIVMPYLGAASARAELARPVGVASTEGVSHGAQSAIGHPGLRLTHRTIRVLNAIDELHGSALGPSNRQIAREAGVTDQGQASKLLARLSRAGLVENRNGRESGHANAWALTAQGQAIVRLLPKTP